MNSSWRNWLELTRISNLPTVLSSALVGTFMVTPLLGDPTLLLGIILPVIVAIAMFYIGGFVLNDVFDIEIDRVERPGRPLPSGRISLDTAARLGMMLLCSGIVLLVISELVSANTGRDSDGFSISFPFGWVSGGLLIALILLYDRFHSRGSGWVFAMGGCRGLVYVTCLLVVSDQLHNPDNQPLFMRYLKWPNTVALPVVPFIISMFFYVAGFSRMARGEVAPEGAGILYCYRCGKTVDPGTTRCGSCRRQLDPSILDRSTAPPLSRGIRYLCLASTFLPILVLLAIKVMGGISAVVKNQEGMINSPQLQTDLVVTIVSCILAALWFVFATKAYCTNPLSPRKPIQMWIAGIALLDGLYLFLYGQWIISIVCFVLFFFTILGHRKVKGT
jgi:4-hydroxybenzoate polyprenyltransferase